MMKNLVLVIAVSLIASCCVAADLPKLHPPDEPPQAKAEAMIRQLFKAEYASNEPAARRALAKKLLAQAQDERTEAASRFVLFREARNVAASAGDVLTALRAVDEMNKVFAIDLIAYKSPIISTAGRAIDNQEDAAIFISAGISLVDRIIAARDFAGAGKLMPPMAIVAGQMKNRIVISGVANRIKYLKDTQIEFERLKAVMNKPGGELSAGKFACFFEDDWQQGLALLAKSGDAKIKDTAAKDLASPKTAPERMALANAWWEIAQKQTAIGKTKLEARARHWYRQALSDAGGLERVQAERRIASSLGAPEDATFFGGHAYTASKPTYGWHEAKLVCELAGGHLAYIESPEEWEFVVKFATGARYWIGATDEEEEGKWHWLNSAPLTFKAWGPGQPDNSKGVQHWAYAANASWDDCGQDEPAAIICEWE
jgi:hypothetical protein